MKNNSLIKYKESFFSKLKRMFKNLFSKNVENNTVSNTENINNINNKEDADNIELNIKKEEHSSVNNINNKEEFFKLYNKVINKEVDLQTLNKEELAKLHEILNEEVRIKRNLLAEKIKILEEKKETLKKLINE